MYLHANPMSDSYLFAMVHCISFHSFAHYNVDCRCTVYSPRELFIVHMLDSETAEQSLYLIIFATLSLKCKED